MTFRGIKWATQVHFKLHLLGREPCCHPGLQSASVWCWWGYRGWATEGLAGQFLPHWTAARQSCKAPPEPLVTTVSKPAAGTAQALCGEAKWESNRRKDKVICWGKAQTQWCDIWIHSVPLVWWTFSKILPRYFEYWWSFRVKIMSLDAKIFCKQTWHFLFAFLIILKKKDNPYSWTCCDGC